MKTIRMEEMTWPAIRDAVNAGYTTAVVAVGATEQHGPHLPTMTDARIGDARGARAEKGVTYLERLAELLVKHLESAAAARS